MPPNERPGPPGLDLRAAETDLAAFAAGPARAAADSLADAFDSAGRRIAESLGRAAVSGEVSLRRLAKTALEELAKIALERIFGPTKTAGASPTFFGARADGGPVTRGGDYLVGERGPELFRPASAGEIGPAAGPVTVHIHLGAGADGPSVLRHEAQIAAAMARAVAYGRRNL